MSWEMVRFGDLYGEPSRNGISVSKNQHDGSTNIVNMGELFASDYVGDSEMRRINVDEAELRRLCLAEGDLLFARRSLVASGAGKAALVGRIKEPTVFESSIIRVRLNQERAYPRFYLYWLKSFAGRDAVSRLVTGTNVKGIRGSELSEVKVPLPSLNEQMHIANILSTYDKLIENSRRQISLLEEAAQRLYKEWFVDLRFPGHETTSIHDGLPEGWRQMRIGDICDTVGGGTPSTARGEFYEGGTIPWVTPTDVTGNIGLYLPRSSKMITCEGLASSSARLLPARSILMTSRATIGAFAICEQEVSTNQGFISCVLHDARYMWWLLNSLQFRVAELRGCAKGSTFLELSKTVFRQVELTVPDAGTAAHYSRVVEELYDKEVAVRRQLDAAREARDRLLPKLMSGEIEVR